MLKSSRTKIILDDSFCNLGNKGEIKSFVKSFIGSVECLCMQPAITLVDFEHIISTKLIQFFLGHRVLGNSLVDKKVFYLHKEVFHQLTIHLGYVQSSI